MAVYGNYNYAEARDLCQSKGAYLAEQIEHDERNALYKYALGESVVNIKTMYFTW